MEHINSQTLTKRLTLSVVAACLISFCGLITETAVNIAFPKIMATFFCLVLGFANIAQIQERPVFVVVLLALGVICLFFFARHCAKAEQPLVKIAVFQNTAFDCHLIAFFLINAVMLGASFLLPNYTQVVIGAASFTAGLILLSGALLNAGADPISGMILDRFDPKFPILSDDILIAVSVILFTCLGMHLTTTLVFVLYLLFGIGCGMAFGSTMTVGMLRLSPEMKPYGNTAFNTLMQFAGAVGTCVAAACVSLSQNNAAPERYTIKTAEGSVHGFLFLSILAVVSVLLQIGGFWNFERKQKI